ncbi:MAG: hypothetical protein NXI15_05640 [Gammaproteobacteria bacterium]|nr:hypothetical protein [Gammaproteobacteria bacterium]
MLRTGLSLAALTALLAAPLPASAARIDADAVSIQQSPEGIRIVAKEQAATNVFAFSPFVAHPRKTVAGFSDPLGVGADPLLKVFDGSVRHMDVLGDFHPSNPYDPSDLAATPESVQTDRIINEILYGVNIPGKSALIASQLDLASSTPSALANQPRTTETSPLVLTGFGSISEFTDPIHLHWTHCPDYAFKRYLFKRTGKGSSSAVQRSRPRNDCFMI